MIKVDVSLSNDVLFELQARLNDFGGRRVFPAAKQAFDSSAKMIQRTWKNWAMGGSVRGAADIKNPNPKLASSIRIRSRDDFDVSIETDSRYMERIQNGAEAYDMKESYPYGKKSRVSEKEVPYLIIPFRWATPNKDGSARAHFGNTIPLVAYKIMQSRNFKKSQTTGEIHLEPNYNGEQIARSNYDWGDRLPLMPEESPNIAGMVKMAGNPHSTYFTFRIISAKSPSGSWIRKAVPANDVVSAIESSTRPFIEEQLHSALEEDFGLD